MNALATANRSSGFFACRIASKVIAESPNAVQRMSPSNPGTPASVSSWTSRITARAMRSASSRSVS